MRLNGLGSVTEGAPSDHAPAATLDDTVVRRDPGTPAELDQMAIEYELLLEDELDSLALRNRMATLVRAVADAEVVKDCASQLVP